MDYSSFYGASSSTYSQHGSMPGKQQGAYAFSQNFENVATTKTSILEAFLPVSIDNEPPLLEELGVNFRVILGKTLAVLYPFRKFDSHIMQDDDLAGPIIFYILFGLLLLLSGKVQFGYVYGLAIIGCLAFFLLLNCMSQATIDMFRVCSVLGYSLIPMVALSTISSILRLKYVPFTDVSRGPVLLALALLSVAWCTASASKLFVSSLQIGHMWLLVSYPVFLFYACFALIAVF